MRNGSKNRTWRSTRKEEVDSALQDTSCCCKICASIGGLFTLVGAVHSGIASCGNKRDFSLSASLGAGALLTGIATLGNACIISSRQGVLQEAKEVLDSSNCKGFEPTAAPAAALPGAPAAPAADAAWARLRGALPDAASLALPAAPAAPAAAAAWGRVRGEVHRRAGQAQNVAAGAQEQAAQQGQQLQGDLENATSSFRGGAEGQQQGTNAMFGIGLLLAAVLRRALWT